MHQGPEAQHLYIHDIIKKCSTSNVAQSPIQPKKEDNRMSSGGVGGKGVVNKGGLHKMITAFYMCSSFHFLYQYEKRFYFILLGININKALRMFHLIGLEMITQATYYRQYNLYVQPSVLLYWKKQQMHLLNQMRTSNAG